MPLSLPTSSLETLETFGAITVAAGFQDIYFNYITQENDYVYILTNHEVQY